MIVRAPRLDVEGPEAALRARIEFEGSGREPFDLRFGMPHDLADKLDDVQADASRGSMPRPEGAGVDDAIRALVSLGYATVDAEKAVRAAVDAGPRGMSAPELIKAALAKVRG